MAYFTIKMNLNKIKNKLKKAYEERHKAAPIALSWSIYRNPALGIAEILSGISPEKSASLRLFGTLTNFITAPLWEVGREYGQKKVVGTNATEESIKWFDRFYSLGVATIDVSLTSAIYYYGFGIDKIRQAVVPSILGYILTANGDLMGRFADTWMDGAGIKKENSRTWFAPNTSLEEKMEITGALNFASLSTLVLYSQPMINSFVERLS